MIIWVFIKYEIKNHLTLKNKGSNFNQILSFQSLKQNFVAIH